MATGPLSLLGDALQQGSRDYLNIKRTDDRNMELRQQQLADETRRRQEMLADDGRNRERQLEDQRTQRGYVEADRTDARNYEQQIYDKRRYDSIILSLVKDGLLDKEDIDNPAAVAGALKQGGVQYERDLAELAKYKAALPDLAKAAGEVEGAEAIMNMGVGDLPAAREIMGRITAKIGKDSQQKQDDDQTNREGFSVAFAANQVAGALLAQRKEEVENALAAIANGQLPPDAMARIQTEVLTENRALAKNPVELAKAVEAKKEKALGIAFVAAQARLVTLEREMTANANAGRVITTAGSAGGYRKSKTALGTETPTAPEKTPEVTPAPAAKTKPDVPDEYMKGAGGKIAPGATPAAAAVTTSAVPPPIPFTPTAPSPAVAEQQIVAEPPVPPAAQIPAAPKWYSVDRDPEANRQAVINAGKRVVAGAASLARMPYDIVMQTPRAVYDTSMNAAGGVYDAAKGAAQMANPANYVPGRVAGSDAVVAFDPRRAAIERDRQLPRRLPEVAADGSLYYPELPPAIRPLPTAAHTRGPGGAKSPYEYYGPTSAIPAYLRP